MLDPQGPNFITVKNLRQGLLVNLRTCVLKTPLKDFNKSLFSKLGKLGSKEKINKHRFEDLV